MIILLALLLAGASSDEISVSGSWKVHCNVFGTESDRTCSFVQKGAEFNGTCSQGSEPATGKIDGTRVIWQLKTQDAGKPLTMEFAGTAGSENQIVGTVSLVDAGVDGEFTATRSK